MPSFFLLVQKGSKVNSFGQLLKVLLKTVYVDSR